jgi:aminopeptidase N
MDEGWATLLPEETVKMVDSSYDYWGRQLKNYMLFAGTEYDFPLAALSNMINSPVYRASSYYKSAVSYYFLMDALGKESFRSALQAFMASWNGKHPVPQDFFNCFNRVAGNLDWFWKPWYYEFKYPDLQLVSAIVKGRWLKISVRNQGGLPLPVDLKISTETGEQQVYNSCAIWKDAVDGMVTLKIPAENNHAEIRLGNRTIPDIHPENNVLVIH